MALLDPYTGAWTSREAAHLARRAGFGARPAEITALVTAGMSAAVDSFVDYQAVDQPLEDLIASFADSTTTDQGKIKAPYASAQIEGWWIFRMVHSTQPLQQQFALFLHDTLVSEWDKVANGVTNSSNYGNDGLGPTQSCTVPTGGLPSDVKRQNTIITRLLLDQHRLFLTQGHGEYGALLRAVTRDPAMLIYLDNRLNIKGKSQENYAREIMELFSMGVGNYSEDDVRAVARAFTGETIDNACIRNWPYTYVYNAAQHDTTSKTVFGTTFNYAGAGQDTDKVIDLILSKVTGVAISPFHSQYPATAVYMSWKILNWFVSEAIAIDHPAVGEMAHQFYNDQTAGYRYNVRKLLRKLFKSSLFFDPAYHQIMHKHPADFMVSALRLLNVDDTSYCGTAYDRLRKMGMRLFSPPNVAGWNHGRAWVNSGNLINRYNYADRVASSTGILTNAQVDALIGNGITGYNDHIGIINYFSNLFFGEPLLPEEQAIFLQACTTIQGSSSASLNHFRRKVRSTVHIMMTMPRFQLK